MNPESFTLSPTLTGEFIRLEPLQESHIDALVAAANGDADLYRWTFVPLTRDAAVAYVREALAQRTAGTGAPLVTIRQSDNRVIGSTRFFELETWKWPAGHPRVGRKAPDVCEIGATWLARDTIRTRANSEAKLLMLTHAFENWGVLRVCFLTDARNERSRNAILRIGAKFEGIIRAQRLASDNIVRDSARYSIVAAEWPEVKERLEGLLRAQ